MSSSLSQASKCFSTNDLNTPPSRRFGYETSKKPKKFNEYPDLQKYIDIILKGSKETNEEDDSAKRGNYYNVKKFSSSDQSSSKESDSNFREPTYGVFHPKLKAKCRRKLKYDDGGRSFEENSENSSLDERTMSKFEDFRQSLQTDANPTASASDKDEPPLSSKIHDLLDVAYKKNKDNEISSSYTSKSSTVDDKSSQFSKESDESDSTIKPDDQLDGDEVKNFHMMIEENCQKRKGHKLRYHGESLRKKFFKSNTLKKLSEDRASSQDELENSSDCDLGKLKLLSVKTLQDEAKERDHERSNKSESRSKKLTESKTDQTRADVFNNQKVSKIFKKIHRIDESDEMSQIYEMVNKTTESILSIANRNEKESKSKGFKVNGEINGDFLDESNKFVQFLNELNSSQSKTQVKKPKIAEFAGSTSEHSEKEKNETTTTSDDNQKSEDNVKKIESGGKTDATDKKAKEGVRSPRGKIRRLGNSSIDRKKNSESNREKGKRAQMIEQRDQEQNEASQKLDEVLKFMHDCITKHKNDAKTKERQKKSTESLNLKDRTKNEPSMQDLTDPEMPQATKANNKRNMSFKKVSNLRSREVSQSESMPGTSVSFSEWTCQKLSGKSQRGTNQNATFKLGSDNNTCDLIPVRNASSHIKASSMSRIPTPESPSPPPVVDINANNDGNDVQIVECNNELGGYEEDHSTGMLMDVSEMRVTKAPFPLSVRTRKKDNIFEVLKNALETEEKLLAAMKIKEPKPRALSTSSSPKSLLVKTDATRKVNAFSFPGGHRSSNFVICVNSLPRKMRTGENIKMSLASSLSISFTDLKNPWSISQLLELPRFPLQQLTIVPGNKRLASTYGSRKEILTKMSRTATEHVARAVHIAIAFEIPRSEESSFETSQCTLVVKTMPLKKSLFVDVSPMKGSEQASFKVSDSFCEAEGSTQSLSSSQSENVEEEVENMMEHVMMLKEAVDETEESFLLLENISEPTENLFQTYDLLGCSSESENCLLKSDFIENGSTCTENDMKKAYDLLVRTYNLQHKLHCYLHKLSCTQSPFHSHQKEIVLDVDVVSKSKSNLEASSKSKTNVEVSSNCNNNSQEKSEDEKTSMKLEKTEESIQTPSYWLESPQINKIKRMKLVESDLEVKRTDTGTSYSPPSESGSEALENKLSKTKSSLSDEKEAVVEEKETVFILNDNEEDDDSSVCSFKSSIDTSENTIETLKNDEKTIKIFSKEDMKNLRFVKRIFNEIGLYIKNTMNEDKSTSLEDNKVDKPEPATPTSPQDGAAETEHRLVEYSGDAKAQAKVLKTVFKGKESTTELSLGLKDIQIRNVSNISVEKKKFSENHTKISISISKEKASELIRVKQDGDMFVRLSKDLLSKNLPSCGFNRFRPSLSNSQTKYSKAGDDVSRSSSDNESDDDDDFKSVVSSLSSRSDAELIADGKEIESTIEVSPPKVFNKHQFDFYRKMDFSYDNGYSKKLDPGFGSVSTFKELEPLQQALTEMQIRMRSIKRNSYFTSNEYYERALKLAKMSAGYCQHCGNRAVIPKDTPECYKNLLTRSHSNHHRKFCLKNLNNSSPNFYSFRGGLKDPGDDFSDLSISQKPSHVFNNHSRSANLMFRPSLKNVPLFLETYKPVQS